MTTHKHSVTFQPQAASQPAFRRDTLTWFAYLILGAFSFVLSIFGPILPFLRAEQGLSYAVSSLHFSAFALGLIVAGLSSDALVRRIGRGGGFLLGGAGLILGLILLALGRHLALTIAASLTIGLFGSLQMVLVSALLGDHHGAQRTTALTEANSLASVCGLLAPLLIGALVRLDAGWWRGGLALAVLALLLIAQTFRRLPIPNPAPSTTAEAGIALPRAYWRYWLGLLLVVAVEFCITLWSGTFLEQRGLARDDATLALSLFIGAMLVGRLVGTQLVRRVALRTCVLGALGLATLGFALHWGAPSLPLNLAGLFIAGLGVANLYPLTLSLAMATAPARAVLASARASLAAGGAMLLLPLLLGWLADQLGIVAAYSLVFGLLAMALLVIGQGRREEVA